MSGLFAAQGTPSATVNNAVDCLIALDVDGMGTKMMGKNTGLLFFTDVEKSTC